jgi:hypothetical protein
MLSNILPSRLSPYVDEIIGGHQRGLRRNRSITGQILHSSDTGEKREYNETVHQVFIDFIRAYELVERKVLYNILIEFGVPNKLVTLIKMCLNESYCKVRTGKYLFDTFPTENGLKQGDALSPLLFNFAL